MNSIIVPVDFSNESLNGLELAIIIGNVIKMDIQMVYVSKKSNDYYHRSMIEGELKFAEEEFEKILKKYKPKMDKGIKLSSIIKKGKIYREIVNQAHSYKESMLVCSTHGASGFEELFMGSNAFKIISATERPVISIRFGVKPKNFLKIVMPIDITADTRQKVPETVELAKKFGAEIHVITVSSSGGEGIAQRLKGYASQVVDYIKDHNVPSKVEYLEGDNIADLILDYANTVDADLISIMTEQGTKLTNFVLGNYTQQILNMSIIPVLSITPVEIHIPGSFRTQGS